jgi:uncharacterized membrane protein
MEISSGFLIVGLLMTLAGALLIYLSLRARPNELKEENNEIRYIGPIPIIVNGGRKWILTALVISSILIVYLITKSVYPELLGGVFVG